MPSSAGKTAPVSLTALVEPAALVADLRRQGFALLPVWRCGSWLAPIYAVLDDGGSSGPPNALQNLAPSGRLFASLKDQPGVKRRAQLRRRGRIDPLAPPAPQSSSNTGSAAEASSGSAAEASPGSAAESSPGSAAEASSRSAAEASSAPAPEAIPGSAAEASFEALEALAQRCFAAVCADAGLPLARVAVRLFPPGCKHKAVFNAVLYVDGGVRSSSSSSSMSGGQAGSAGPAADGDEVGREAASAPAAGDEAGREYQINGALDGDLGAAPWCRSHGDPGLLTLLARSDRAALQLQARGGGGGVGDVSCVGGAAWVDVEPMMDRLADETRAQLASASSSNAGGSDGDGVEVLLLVAGYSLERLTAGAYVACVHRVPRSAAPGARRRTAAFELRPAVDIWRSWREEAAEEEVARPETETPAAR